MDEYGFPTLQYDEWGFPIQNNNAVLDDFGNPIMQDELSFMQQQQMVEQNLMNQQLLMQQQESQYAQQELLYSAQASQQKYITALMRGRQVHYTSHEIVNGLRNYVTNISGGLVPRVLIKVEDFPDVFRHACAYTKEKITYLPLYYFKIPEIGTQIPFYYCKACRKLYYPKDII